MNEIPTESTPYYIKKTTAELIEFVDEYSPKIIEARVLLNGGAATHFLYTKNHTLYNEGIDGVNYSIARKDFIAIYDNCAWIIDQVV